MSADVVRTFDIQLVIQLALETFREPQKCGESVLLGEKDRALDPTGVKKLRLREVRIAVFAEF